MQGYLFTEMIQEESWGLENEHIVTEGKDACGGEMTTLLVAEGQ